MEGKSKYVNFEVTYFEDEALVTSIAFLKIPAIGNCPFRGFRKYIGQSAEVGKMPVLDWEKTITCPYNPSHQITVERIQV